MSNNSCATAALLVLGLISSWAVRGAQAASPDTNPPGSAASQSAAAAQPVQHFDVNEYRVVGNSALSGRDIERLLYPLLGPNKTFADVEAARTALEKLYHDQGYGASFVDIPPQTVDDGIVRLRVTEGRIERTQINGAHYFPERDVMAKLPAATPGTVLQISKLQSELTAVNSDTADRSVVPVLKAGSAPGTVDIALQVNDTLPLHGSLEVNNQATIDTRELRSIASVSYGDMFGRLDNFALQYQFTPQLFDQVRVFAANYVMHAFDSGLQPSFTFIDSNSNVPAAGTSGVLGIGEISSAKLAYPVVTTPNSLQSVSIGADYKHFRNTINQNDATALVTPITYMNLSAEYDGLWRTDRFSTTLSLSADAGPRGLVNNSTTFANDRYKGQANYFYLRWDLATVIKLPADFNLRLRTAGQGATEPLITNEDYSIAGIDGVRGYLEAEELGDKAVKGTIQLTSPGWRHGAHVIGDVYGFYDAASMTVIDPLAGEPAGITLHSWGFGLDLLPGEKLTGSVAWAKALDTASVTKAGSSRALFLLRGSF
jgi:hemolysin activation/secretion protein